MNAVPRLDDILSRADVWRGDALATAPLPGLASGFAALDAELPGGGWPRAGLTELLPASTACGELSLLLPALARLSADELAWVVCIAPPYPLHAPALAQGGVDLTRLLVAGAPGRDAAWVCARALEADGVGAVVAWLPQTDASALRRLQLLAEASRALLVVFRPPAVATQPSPAPLRLTLDGDGERLRVRILKRRGAPPTAPLSLAVPRPASFPASLPGSLAASLATPFPTLSPIPSHALARPVPAAPAARRAARRAAA